MQPVNDDTGSMSCLSGSKQRYAETLAASGYRQPNLSLPATATRNFLHRQTGNSINRPQSARGRCASNTSSSCLTAKSSQCAQRPLFGFADKATSYWRQQYVVCSRTGDIRPTRTNHRAQIIIAWINRSANRGRHLIRLRSRPLFPGPAAYSASSAPARRANRESEDACRKRENRRGERRRPAVQLSGFEEFTAV